MRQIFVDTFFWLALFNPRDTWHDCACAAQTSCADARLVTNDEILVEFLAGISNRGPELRNIAAKAVRTILDNPNIEVIPQTRLSFLAGLERYEKRSDKEYSLTDCISMQQMSDRNITEILTHDHHFEQEGFVVLLKGN
jgi:uncharacterized protein